jgi:histidine triad (HIT) family protein
MDGCLFCKMGSGEVAATRITENNEAFAIRDINPRAPVHALIIPRTHIPSARDIEFGHSDVLAGMFRLAQDVARLEGVFEGGFRLAFNVGDAAGMTISHLHMHLLGGRRLGPEG